MRFKLSISFFLAASVIPFFIGSSVLQDLISSTDYASPAPACYAAKHIGATNLLAIGFTWFVLALIGMQRKEKWVWNLLFILIVFVGGSDSLAALWLYQQGQIPFPIPLVTTSLAVIGLILSYKEVYTSSKSCSSCH